MNPFVRALYLLTGRIGTAPLFAPLHRVAYRALGGRLVGRLFRTPIVLLTTTGRKSGLPRTTPLMAVPDGDRLLVVASNAGKDRAPDWYLNLRADPCVRVQQGSDTRAMRARDAVGPEAGPLWERATRAYPGYGVYRDIAHREIPLVVLEPSEEG
ncbi:MAG: nitroreductase family deazaflavin-dependent oxidoreductase [Candidatus Limnocylindria bacterium]